ncbi:translation initiation factor IF-2-like [Grus japonensis]|uniref:Translation initiation factor IF-2-like n=1 Tax=Grus japonensis TaxID=30415 RepID=A0ABC9WV23_GRUJA
MMRGRNLERAYDVNSVTGTLAEVFESIVKELVNERTIGFGRDLWRSSSPTLLLKQDHLEQVAQDHVQVLRQL